MSGLKPSTYGDKVTGWSWRVDSFKSRKARPLSTPENKPYTALMPMAAFRLWMDSGAVAVSMPTTNLQAKIAMNKARGSQLPGTVKRWVPAS